MANKLTGHPIRIAHANGSAFKCLFTHTIHVTSNRLVQDTDIVDFSLKSKGFSLSVRKKEALQAEQAVAMPVGKKSQGCSSGILTYIFPCRPSPSTAPAPVAAAPAAPAAPAPAAAPAPPPAPAAPKGVEVTSPMAGTFYRKPAPGEPAFAKEGDKVKKGQTVCIIEAMKLMNEIEAEVGGEVVKFLVENGQPVTVGQPIMLIKP
ncbi:hypothetical protein VOLCADRAFT_81953 [Volvox carteri f. nagariensis]|uniref:Biotin carboxyl carrier protein of acetyl-CoA carboxylase n=1 Tax=Volvox carteri f. nagariensis TaxID=3068 RepID=D8U256_VOLCA|nr:uncharacterized protein VOLCADRAFT_81953 [Volvox carteri f. nagariensis]EFJ46223.1 hypothetical protein VOLCADRAFT_81953 [Volvox carteri f. nagariensis]|eukprot:XP_002952670.1 hypothetical protein VOLCADRAFT_81953 [Volvox carteri f. nagariensis]